MAPRSERDDRWPTILWIAWRAGDVEHQEPLCLDHRTYVFEHYAASAHGLRRRGDWCTMCDFAHPPQRPRSAIHHIPQRHRVSPRPLRLGAAGPGGGASNFAR
jgi:hypothetical protein